MASNINRVVLVGNLTKDPELRQTPSGTDVCKLRVAVNTRVKKEGEWTDKANYFDVTLWGNTAANAAKYLSKGRPVAIDGRLDWHEWEQDGNKRQAVEIIAENVQFLGGGQGGGGNSGGGQPDADSSASTDEDIPF